MQSKNNALLSEYRSEYWAMEPRKLEDFFQKIAAIDPTGHTRRGEMFDTEEKPDRGMIISGGVAMIPILGVLLKEVPRWFKSFGIAATSYIDIQANIKIALGDPEVEKIILKVESPGGFISGVEETADLLFKARAQKPVIAHIEDLGASAAYWLASQARTISANSTGEVGSIGVYSVYDDFSKFFEDQGIKTIVIRSGAHKGMGVFGAAISDDQIEAVQEVIDGLAGKFIKAVARGRGTSENKIEAVATGRVWLAGPAKELGLIDNVETFNSALKGAPSGAQTNNAHKEKGENDMGGENKTDDKSATQEPDGANAAQTSAKESAAVDTGAIEKAAAKKERDRCSAILSKAKSLGLTASAAKAQIDSGTDIKDATIALQEAKIKATADNAPATTGMGDDKPEVVGEDGQPGASAPAADANDEEALKKEWAASEELKADFMTPEDYVNYKQGQEKGMISDED